MLVQRVLVYIELSLLRDDNNTLMSENCKALLCLFLIMKLAKGHYANTSSKPEEMLITLAKFDLKKMTFRFT
jgi:hypothetical protein